MPANLPVYDQQTSVAALVDAQVSLSRRIRALILNIAPYSERERAANCSTYMSLVRAMGAM